MSKLEQILQTEGVVEIVKDEILNHWYSYKGACSCGAFVDRDPDNMSMHTARAIIRRLYQEQDKLNG